MNSVKRSVMILCLCMGLLPVTGWAAEAAPSEEELRAAIFARPVASVGGVEITDGSEPLFLAKGPQNKAMCTQDMCPGGGSVACETTGTCKVRCGGVKCQGQDFKKCPNPCCTRTFQCLDGTVVTCRNWRSNDCTQSAEGVECDGICPPFDPCSVDPCRCSPQPFPCS